MAANKAPNKSAL